MPIPSRAWLLWGRCLLREPVGARHLTLLQRSTKLTAWHRPQVSGIAFYKGSMRSANCLIYERGGNLRIFRICALSKTAWRPAVKAYPMSRLPGTDTLDIVLVMMGT